MIISKDRVRGALAHAQQQLPPGSSMEQACAVAAQQLGIAVEAVQEVASEVAEASAA